MRNISLSVLLIILVAGCQKNEEPVLIATGRWSLQKLVLRVYEGNDLKEVQNEPTDRNDIYFLFSNDFGVQLFTEGEATVVGTYSYKNQRISIKSTEGETLVFPVKSLKNNNLILLSEESRLENGVLYKIESELHFAKD